MSERLQTSPETAVKPLRRPRLLGLLAFALWGAAPAISAADAVLGYNQIKILILTAGLIMVDLAGAVVISIMWYVSRYYVEPLKQSRAENEYCYRAGFRDATMRFLRPGADLYLVRPVAPPAPQHVPAQPRGYFAAEQRADR